MTRTSGDTTSPDFTRKENHPMTDRFNPVDLLGDLDPHLRDEVFREGVRDEFESCYHRLAPAIWYLLVQDMRDDAGNLQRVNATLNTVVSAALLFVTAVSPDEDGRMSPSHFDEVRDKLLANLEACAGDVDTVRRAVFDAAKGPGQACLWQAVSRDLSHQQQELLDLLNTLNDNLRKR